MHRVSLKGKVEEDVGEQQSCLSSCKNFLRKINPCLRPQKQSQQLSKYLQKYSQISIYQDPYFGQSFLLESQEMDQLVVLKKQKHSEVNVGQRQRKLQQLQSFNGNPNIINENLIDKIHKVGFLWSNYQFYLTYDYILVDLNKQFTYRQSEGRKFTQNQITNIMKGTCKGLVHLQTTDYSAVRMSHIYFDQDGIVKVSHPHLFNYRSNLQILCQNDDEEGFYLSPEEMLCLQRGEKDAILGWKSNSYVLGMVLLSLMRMKHMSDVYDFSSCEIDKRRIQQILINCKDDYSQRLVSIIQKMLLDKPQDRLTLRSVVNKLSYKQEANQQITIELVEDREKDNQQYDYKPDQKKSQPEHYNYLTGLVYPKVGRAGEYFNQDQSERFSPSRKHENQENIVAEQRFYYQNRNSTYIGEGTIGSKKNFMNDQDKNQKPIRQGKGVYKNQDGQLYIGDWKKGQMNGHGKLFWDEQKIRYEGNFKDGEFNGRGTQYNGGRQMVGHADEQDAIDQTFVRMQKDNWQKYEGNFREDKRDGQGIAYFRTGKWMGNFKQGQPNGQGIFVNSAGKKFKGVWKNGILQE